MNWLDSFDLILLDLDGLLVDTEKIHYQAYSLLCQEQGTEIPWDFLGYLYVAHGAHDGLRNALHPLFGGSWEAHYKRKCQLYCQLLDSKAVSFMPGAEELIENLVQQKKKRAIVTHSSKEQVERISVALPQLKRIPVWVTREDYKEAKPASDAYFHAIELLADPLDRIVGFEDSLRGIEALKGTTLALPVLVCDPNHKQMQDPRCKSVLHCSSLSGVPEAMESALT